MAANPAARGRHGASAAAAPCAPLDTRRAGEVVRIVEVGGSAALKRRLRDLGLRPGKAIEICQESPAGVVVSAAGLKLALAPEAARQVLVEERTAGGGA